MQTCVLLAPGFEEIEAITVLDVLRRAQIDVKAIGIESNTISGSHQITLHADGILRDVASEAWQMIVLPGGMPGARNLQQSALVQSMLKQQVASERWVAAICAGPIALASAGLLEGKQATCFPGFEGELHGARVIQKPVVIDGHVVTAQGPGLALNFALTLVNCLRPGVLADKLAKDMLTASI